MDRFEHTIEVNAPVMSCYYRWHHFDQFPEFMDHVKSVTAKGDLYHWVVKGPLGKDVEYDAVIDQDEPGLLISWHSTDGDLKVMGEVRFEELDLEHCRITTALQYEAPMGPVGDLVASIFSYPEEMVKEDLEHFKDLVETQEHTYNGPFGLEDEQIGETLGGEDAETTGAEVVEDTPYIGLSPRLNQSDDLEMRDGDGFLADAEDVVAEAKPELFSDDGKTLIEADVFTQSMDIYHEDLENFVEDMDEMYDSSYTRSDGFEEYLEGSQGAMGTDEVAVPLVEGSGNEIGGSDSPGTGEETGR